MRNHSDPGIEVKICKRPSCRVPFERPANMKQKNWEECVYCPKHRQRSGRKELVDKRNGMYEVKHEAIDLFLYGR